MQEKSGIFYGWWIVVATSIVLFVGMSSGIYTVAVFLQPLQRQFGWTITQISLGFTIASIFVGILSPLVGGAVARYGVKKAQLFGAFVVGLGLIAFSFIETLWHFYVLNIAVAVGLAAVGLVPAQTIISLWFEKLRGIAMGIILAGFGLGGMAMVLLTSEVNEAFGWRFAYRLLGSAVLIIVVPVVLLVIKDRPGDIGLRPDGESDPVGLGAAGVSCELSFRKTVASLPFQLFCLTALLFNISFGGLTMHSIALFGSYGIANAAAIWSLTLGVSVLGKLFFGYLSDKTLKKGLIVVSWILHIMAFGSIMALSYHSWFIWCFVASYGLAIGSFLTLRPVFVCETFGIEHFSKCIGLIVVYQVVGISLGGILLGKIYDSSKSYESAVLLLALICAVALILTIFVGRPMRTAATLVKTK